MELIVKEGVVTGEIEMPLNCPSKLECNNPSICKREIMKDLAEEFNIPLSQTIAIGDNWVDICMVEAAGMGIAFNPKVKELEEAADVVIGEPDLRFVLRNINIK
jgi:hydroxymethylpyrimidine pyrophosphatase-like HAD family hydrolase